MTDNIIDPFALVRAEADTEVLAAEQRLTAKALTVAETGVKGLIAQIDAGLA